MNSVCCNSDMFILFVAFRLLLSDAVCSGFFVGFCLALFTVLCAF